MGCLSVETFSSGPGGCSALSGHCVGATDDPHGYCSRQQYKRHPPERLVQISGDDVKVSSLARNKAEPTHVGLDQLRAGSYIQMGDVREVCGDCGHRLLEQGSARVSSGEGG